jgi:hypothetical protein
VFRNINTASAHHNLQGMRLVCELSTNDHCNLRLLP